VLNETPRQVEQSGFPFLRPKDAEWQRLVNRYFEQEVGTWTELYGRSDVSARVFHHRQALALRWVDRLALNSEARVLEVGSGAGFLSVNLARRGLSVVAVDSVSDMVETTRRHAAEAGLAERVTARLGDVQRLDLPDNQFDLVVALGVIDWVPEPAMAVSEMGRVLRPGGWLIVSSGNSAALVSLIEPLKNYWLAPLKRGVKVVLHRLGRRERAASARQYRQKFLDRLLSSAGLLKVESRTVGFGPFTVFRQPVFPKAVSQRVHERLQELADRDVPIVRSAGFAYMVLARKR
jgi:2-polyprenyl-3-methyl-5-hydroxy-6-metoxy-1,4-benzoquinol methylase